MVAGTPWAVEPAQRVGAFVLGMGVNEALSIVQKMGSLDAAEFSFDEQRLFDTDLSLRMPSLGLQLCFDGFQQDLRVISVCIQASAAQRDGGQDLVVVPPLVYGNRTFAGGGQSALALRDVYKMFGPTWIGDFRFANVATGDHAAYFLRYPGLAFEFPLPEDLVEALAARSEHPMELPGHAPPLASRMWIYAQDSPSFETPFSAVPDMPEIVVIRPSVGVVLRGRELRFGAMPQDVFSDFGPPEQVCVKDVDSLRIHSASSLPSRFSGPDYYYNYFHLGLDVLFDGRTHLVKKIILHTNPPTHELFSRYSRCFFELPIYGDRLSTSLGCPGLAPGGVPSGVLSEPAEMPAFMLTEAVEDEMLAEAPSDVRTGPLASKHEGMGSAAVIVEDASGKLPSDLIGMCSGEQVDDVPGDGLGDGADLEDDFNAGGSRRMSKKDRKAQKKGKKGAVRSAVGSPLQDDSAGASPVLSVLSTSPEPSPSHTALSEAQSDTLEGNATGDTAPFVALPPPAVPLDGLDAVISAEAQVGISREATAGGTSSGSAVKQEGGEQRRMLPEFSAGNAGNAFIDVQWSWQDVQEVLASSGDCNCGKPLIMSQSGHTSFGSTYFYAVPGLAFEVMQNGFLASVTVFTVPREELPAVFSPQRSAQMLRSQ